ncbi:MAG: hydantoinase/oxoprolinase family protein [Alphaproteobacteria bacterium]|jgi:N-methylhydantoinase A|nr:hydantoinase/oxoprolinase family protein [Alphaproteobacteria bacterium]MDP6590100.1 hydantoinase/oxoprolinase family protein [Alphaproteobacteria bacterium]MDP6816550.1 hydantoinase/oxoprolinase family protein [Alphaproteobacteria bacterium]
MNEAIVGVDVGGTFTDLVYMEPGGGDVRIAKVPTTPANQAEGFMAALAEAGVELASAANISHGTTTTTNALLERKLSRCGLITTKGFRDVLELGRRTRPRPYGLLGSFTPLVPRELRYEVAERMDAEGNVLTPLDEEALRQAVRRLIAAGCESLVVHFLHSYRNPAHERRAVEIAREIWPNAYITAGHAILSEYREYERGVTATVNASVQPVLQRYLENLRRELADGGFRHDLLVMQGNGGSISSAIAAEAAVKTVMSGPASGVMAAAATARAAGIDNLITFDTGGTSCDVGLVQGGVPDVTAEMELEYAMPIHVPMVDVHTIGAGGGSIAFVNEAGMLQVGPESAGAEPGPICYGRGGARPTITDANLLLGRLDPAHLLGVAGEAPLKAVRDAVMREIGAPLGLGLEAAAAAIIDIGNDRMAGAIRMVTLARGHDPRDFTLFAFGGAGPMHAAALARELSIPRLLVPACPGITNAIGCITADLRHDYVNTLNAPLSALDINAARAILEAQIAEGRATIEREGVAVTGIDCLHFADMQFEGQTHLLTVAISGTGVQVAELQAAFEAAYLERFHVELPEIRAVLVSLHTAVIGRRPGAPLEALAAAGNQVSVTDARRDQRPVWFAGRAHETPVYRRHLLPADAALIGPAIIEQLDCTTVIEPDNGVSLDGLGNLVIEVTA